MGEYLVSGKKYSYMQDRKWPCEAIDVHHVLVRKSSVKSLLLCLAATLLLANVLYLFLLQEKSFFTILWNFLLCSCLVKLFLRKSIEKESILIMPSFGVQLESHCGRGKIVQRFVPFSKILKPVLNEHVTPITCYWSLSLILRGEEELMPIFKELRPPLKMLVPIWTALCAATDIIESDHTHTHRYRNVMIGQLP